MHQPVAQRQKWRKMFLILVALHGITMSIWLFWYRNKSQNLQREKLLTDFYDAQAQTLENVFNLRKNNVHSLANLVSLYHQEKNSSVIDQEEFSVYTERTAFERRNRGIAYALKVPHSERELFEKQRGCTIKKMGTEGRTLFQNCIPQKLDPAPIHDEYAPVIFYEETVSHIVSIELLSGKVDRENILRARTTGKGVLTVESTVGFKQKHSLPWRAICALMGILIDFLLMRYIFNASINNIDKVNERLQLLEKLTRQAKASDVAKSQFITTFSNKIRSPMKDLLGILHMLMDTDLDANQLDHAHTAYASWKDLIGLIDVLDMAKIESGRVELEALPFDLRSFLKENFLLLSGESNKKEE